MANAAHIPNVSVGTVALCAYLRHMIEEGVRILDMMHGYEAYKHHWAKENDPLFQAQWGQRTLPGSLYYLHSAINTSPLLRHVFKRLCYPFRR
jgi:CelD/BcsL family acetyltransferase involved in cellulose biosynthesis